MQTLSYDINLLPKAQTNLAWMLDFGVNVYGIALREFYDMFLKSKYCRQFARGDDAVIEGMSGRELAYYIVDQGQNDISMSRIDRYIERSPEYWIGWSLAYYQWYSGMSFEWIDDFADIDYINSLYSKYHEIDIRQFCDVMDEKKSHEWNRTALKRLRSYALLSQAQLAKQTGIPLKTIQQYEQGQKDIRHARVDSVIALSRALSCKVEDLVG